MPHATKDSSRAFGNRAANLNLHRLSGVAPRLFESTVNRKHWLQIASTLILAVSAPVVGAQSQAITPKVKLTGVTSPSGSPIASSPFSGSAIVFGSATVAGAPQQLTATFATNSGVIPTGSLHYGHDFSLGAVSCSGGSCSVTVSFAPTLPGSRPDALFLSDGTQRIATIPLSGAGEAPYALLQPVVPASGTSSNGSSAVLDENGTLYLLESGRVTAIDSTGKSSQLPISGLSGPHGLTIDGAGVLYILNGGTDASIVTFDTVQNIQGSRSIAVPAATVDSIAAGTAGELYAVSSSAHLLYTVAPDGTVSKTPLQGGSDGSEITSAVVLPGATGLAFGGSTLQTVSHAGARTSIALASAGSVNVLGSDSAGTLYANSASSLLELSAPAFGAAIGSLPSALAIGSDGALAIDNRQSIERLDRTGTSLYFGAATSATDPQLAMLYNAGNAALAISDIHVSGTGYGIVSTTGNTCVAGTVVASGSSCEIGVTFDKSQSTGSADGTVTVTSNSLNLAAAQSNITLHPHLVGSQATLSVSSLVFPSTTVKIASAPLTVTLTNTGTAALDISSIALAGAGSGSYSTTNNCPAGVGTSLAPNLSCTITVIFTPLSASTISATITVADDANQTGTTTVTQVVTLSGVGIAAPAPVTTLSPTTLAFGGTTVALEVFDGTSTPPSSTVTITNTGNATLNISSISITYALGTLVFPYTLTNNCGATLAAAANCTAIIQFAPPEGGGASYPATLVVADNSLGSPHTLAITGASVPDDFTISTSTPSVTIPSSGGSGTFSLTALPDPGPFPTPVNFVVFGMPAGATYSFSPSSINPATAAAASSLIVILPAYHNTTLSNLNGPGKLKLTYGPVAACLLAGILFGVRRRKMPQLTRILQIAILGLLGLASTSLTACGGIPQSSGVAPGSYPLSITGNSANGFPASYSNATGYYPYGIPVKQVTVNLIVQ